jgi:3-deoxy-manno-octulosonate cytidylyltransferase (CMP-KDO synthetase)
MRISKIAKGFGAEVAMTSRKHKSGTDRIAQVCRNLRASIVVNIQGDEPLIPLDTIASVVRVMVNNPKVPMATAVCQIKNSGEVINPNIVKVTLDKNNYAMYFSRSPIPHNSQVFYKHIGIYAYRRNFLLGFVKLKESKLEQTEKLEQLRVLENGYSIKVAVVKNDSIPVDVPEDIKKVEKYLCMTKLARN